VSPAGRFLTAHAATDPSRPRPSIAASPRRSTDVALSRGLTGARRARCLRPGCHHRPHPARRIRTGVPPPAGLSPPAAIATPLSTPLSSRSARKKFCFFPESFRGVRGAGRGARNSRNYPHSTRHAPKDSQSCGRRPGGYHALARSRGRDPDTAAIATAIATRRRGWPGRLARPGDEVGRGGASREVFALGRASLGAFRCLER
jgi:hypothetical protein